MILKISIVILYVSCAFLDTSFTIRLFRERNTIGYRNTVLLICIVNLFHWNVLLDMIFIFTSSVLQLKLTWTFK